MIKDILLPLLQGQINEPATRQACMLARQAGATVTALVAASYFAPAMAAWAFYREDSYPDLDSAGAAILGRFVAQAEERPASESIQHSVRGVAEFWNTPAEIVIRHSAATDLIVLGVGRLPEDVQRKLFAGVLVGAGRPILAVPVHVQARQFSRVLVAWKNCREASRALRDAMPILRQAQTVEILRVGATEAAQSSTDEGMELIEHLHLHGVAAHLTTLPRTDATTGWTIVDHAVASGADLVVAGGYGHAHALEQVFGGVTLHLLTSSPVPVLFSH